MVHVKTRFRKFLELPLSDSAPVLVRARIHEFLDAHPEARRCMKKRRMRWLAVPLAALLWLAWPEAKTQAMWSAPTEIDRLRVVGREGPCERAAAWMRPALESQDRKIRASAAAWYREVDPGWADDPKIREAVLSGIRFGDGK